MSNRSSIPGRLREGRARPRWRPSSPSSAAPAPPSRTASALPRSYPGGSRTPLRPAEFGNWTAQQDLNTAYDAAEPDLVLVTLGADDLKFLPIVEACIYNGYEYYLDIASLECTAANPGSTVHKDFFEPLSTLQANYRTLVSWIQARGQKAGKVPKILFTGYHDPLPPAGVTCPDTYYLYDEQSQYLSSLLGQLNDTVLATIQGLNDPGGAVADISQAMTGPDGTSHRWCTDRPWAYGLSIYTVYQPISAWSQAPFHPTPDGHQRIAELVLPVVDSLFRG